VSAWRISSRPFGGEGLSDVVADARADLDALAGVVGDLFDGDGRLESCSSVKTLLPSKRKPLTSTAGWAASDCGSSSGTIGGRPDSCIS
jgi:hypothetical protein